LPGVETRVGDERSNGAAAGVDLQHGRTGGRRSGGRIDLDARDTRVVDRALRKGDDNLA